MSDAKEITEIRKRVARLGRITTAPADDVSHVILCNFDRALELAHSTGRRSGLKIAIDRLVKQQSTVGGVDAQIEILALQEHLFEPLVAVDALEVPDLVCILDYMLRANDLLGKQQKEWPADMGFDYVRLNNQASQLTQDEKEIVADGEESEANEIVAKHNCHQLSAFLSEVFDGYFTDLFCVPV